MEYTSGNQLLAPHEAYRRISKNNLWFIKVLNRELLKAGNVSLSRNSGFASISFLSSTSIMFRADFVSPYFESCSFCLAVKRENVNQNQFSWTIITINIKNKQAKVPKIIESKQLSYLLEKFFIERCKNLKVLNKNLNSLCPILSDGRNHNIDIVKTYMTIQKQISEHKSHKNQSAEIQHLMKRISFPSIMFYSFVYKMTFPNQLG